VSTRRASSGGKRSGARSALRCAYPCARTSGCRIGDASAVNMNETRRSDTQMHRDESEEAEAGAREQE
jgi:hypothetical protein